MIEEMETTGAAELNRSEKTLEKKKPIYKKKRVFAASIVAFIAIILSFNYYLNVITYVSTDDAYIEGHSVKISSKVSGIVKDVYIDDNQKIKQGKLLAVIDPVDYQVKYDQAVARLEAAIEKQKGTNANVSYTAITSKATADQASSALGAAKASLKVADKQIAQAKASLAQVNSDINSARAEFKLAEINYSRYDNLFKKGVVSKQDFDRAITSYETQKAKLNAALQKYDGTQAAVQSAYANKEVAQKAFEQAISKLKGSETVNEQVSMSDSQSKIAKAEIKQLQAAVKQAKLDIGYTKIYAPQTGTITGKSLEVGSYIQVGQALLTIVPEKRWVLANFKETQLTDMKVGQPVLIKVDAYPNKVFKGHVDSIQTSTGAKTSLFPPENAVGSFVKVVQRVPVKIVFDEAIGSQFSIVPGMSVIPEVKVK